MSRAPLSRSADLQRLRDEGYEVSATEQGHLVVHNIPYVNSARQMTHATLVSKLTLAGEVTVNPVDDHVVFWTGDHPCDQNGNPLPNMVNPGQQPMEDGLVAECSFSCKPTTPYVDYHAKMTNYIAMVSGPAEAIDPTVTARTYRIVEDDGPDSPFIYPDIASSRVGIATINDRLRGLRIALVGVGGTGSYILDLIAKTPVAEIHLFDGDDFLSHNAFRAPGAATLAELNERPTKVDRFEAVYSRIKHGIVAHAYSITVTNVEELRGFDFVFLSMDGGRTKRSIIERLTEWGSSFIDVGMGIKSDGGLLRGVLRVTTGTAAKHDHLDSRIDFSDPAPDDIYDENIQVVELNALNATLAVIKWKKLMGVYADDEHEHSTAYTIDGNDLANEDEG